MKRKLLNSSLALALSLSFQATPAFLDFHKQGFDRSIFVPPEIDNPTLDKKVSFRFKDSPLSQVLITLGRIGDFNTVLDNNLDRNITISVKDRNIQDVFIDLERITKLHHKFQDNTLSFTDLEIEGLGFKRFNLAFTDPRHIEAELNNILTKVSPNKEERGYLFIHPQDNSIIISGNKKEIQACKNYIDEIDKAGTVKLHKLIHIDKASAIDLIHFTLKDSKLDFDTFREDTLVIKGNDRQVEAATQLVEQADQSKKDITFRYDLYSLKPTKSKDTSTLLKYFNFQAWTSNNAETRETDEYKKLLSSFKKIESNSFAIKPYQVQDQKFARFKVSPSLLNQNIIDTYLNKQAFKSSEPTSSYARLSFVKDFYSPEKISQFKLRDTDFILTMITIL